jgi:hypothetical protein
MVGNSVLALLILVEVENVADVLEGHADSISRINPESGGGTCRR